MILLNCLFITNLLIDSKVTTNNKDTTMKLYHFPDNQSYSREISNLIIWRTLLENLNKEHFITIEDLVNEYTFLSNEEIIHSCKKITNDNNIYFYDFNKFMFSIIDTDYQKLLSLIKTDYLKTPSDWSTISSETSSVTSLELNQEIIDIDTNNSNINTKVKFFDPKKITIDIKHTPKHINKYPITINPLLTPITLNIKEIQDPLKDIQSTKLNEPDQPDQPKEQEQPKKSEQPKEITIDPIQNINPNLKSRTKNIKQSTHYKKMHKENKKKYSWYIDYLVYCYKYLENCITNCPFYKKIEVPIWLKKYF